MGSMPSATAARSTRLRGLGHQPAELLSLQRVGLHLRLGIAALDRQHVRDVLGAGKLGRQREAGLGVLLGELDGAVLHGLEAARHGIGRHGVGPHAGRLHHRIHELPVGGAGLLDVPLRQLAQLLRDLEGRGLSHGLLQGVIVDDVRPASASLHAGTGRGRRAHAHGCHPTDRRDGRSSTVCGQHPRRADVGKLLPQSPGPSFFCSRARPAACTGLAGVGFSHSDEPRRTWRAPGGATCSIACSNSRSTARPCGPSYAGRSDHVHDHGLHHLRQPGDPRRGRHGPRRGVRRHLPRRRVRLGHDGALRQLSGGAGAGHGPQRLLHLRRGQGHGPCLGDGARRRVPVRRAVPDRQPDGHPRVGDQRGPAQPQAVDRRRHRPVPGGHRAAERRHHRRAPGDAGHARQPEGAGRADRRARPSW